MAGCWQLQQFRIWQSHRLFSACAGGEAVKHLRYDCMGAAYSGESRHPQEVIRELGIKYERAIPQSMGDQWWLFNCQHGELPKYITEMKCDNWMAKQYLLPDAYVNDNQPASQ